MQTSRYLHLSLLLLVSLLNMQAAADIQRTASGKPDLSGTYDTGILTPTARPEWLGETEYLYPWVANFLNWAFSVASQWAVEGDSDPDREAPPCLPVPAKRRTPR